MKRRQISDLLDLYEANRELHFVFRPLLCQIIFKSEDNKLIETVFSKLNNQKCGEELRLQEIFNILSTDFTSLG